MIKGKSPYPFERIALAVAFSPRLEGLVVETRRLQQLHQAEVIFIHVGKKTSDKQRQLHALLNQHGFSDVNSRIFWEQGTPADIIPRICKSEIVDLLVLGALQRSDVLAGYMGSLSTDISRKAKCSVLLLTTPESPARSVKKIAVNGSLHRKTQFTLKTVAYVADLEKADEIWVVSPEEQPVFSRFSEVEDGASASSLSVKKSDPSDSDSFSEPAGLLNHFIRTVNFRTLSERNGPALGEFAREQGVDLLVVNSPDHSLSIFDRILPHDIEDLLADLPCNLLIVHSRFADQGMNDSE